MALLLALSHLIRKKIYSFIIFLYGVAYLQVISSPELLKFTWWVEDQFQQGGL